MGLVGQAPAGIDEENRRVDRRRRRHHVARVLLVPWRIGSDEGPGRRAEVAPGHVNCDPLLSLGIEPVRQPRQVGLSVLSDQPGEDIFRNPSEVVNQSPDQC